MNILVVGGTGHAGSYLVPRLVRLGHDVTVVARTREPKYVSASLGWKKVKWITADRREEEKAESWLLRMRSIQAEVVIDLICFTPEQNKIMYDAFHGRVKHFLHCGTIWAYGPGKADAYEESFARAPITSYGKNKAAIEAYLVEKFRKEDFPSTIIHPGHISGRRWYPIDPQGCLGGVEVYERLARGREVLLPGDGSSTLHHIHADDLAQVFELAIARRDAVLGESFSAVSPAPLSLHECCSAVSALFGRLPNLRCIPLEEMTRHVDRRSFELIQEHVTHSPRVSLEKARRHLGYVPRYSTEQIYVECLEYLCESGKLQI